MTIYKYIPLCHISELEKYLFRSEIAGQNVCFDLVDHRIENYTFRSGIDLIARKFLLYNVWLGEKCY